MIIHTETIKVLHGNQMNNCSDIGWQNWRAMRMKRYLKIEYCKNYNANNCFAHGELAKLEGSYKEPGGGVEVMSKKINQRLSIFFTYSMGGFLITIEISSA